jgi:hypothetical protein
MRNLQPLSDTSALAPQLERNRFKPKRLLSRYFNGPHTSAATKPKLLDKAWSIGGWIMARGYSPD